MKIKEDFFTRKKNEIGVTLNDVQKKAVIQTEGPLLLLASPGSGKTTTIIMRIGYLIEEKGVDPARIKAVTFSRASANDMKERFKRFFPHLPPVDFSTIHSFAFEVVKEHFRRTRTYYQIIEGDLDLEEQNKLESNDLPIHKKIILRNLFKAIVGENITDDQMDELMTYISFIKNKMIPAEHWSTVKVDVPEAERILREYEEFKRSGHSKLLVDFDDMLTIAEQVLERDGELLRKYQDRFDYVLKDESQDTSMVQHAIIEKLVRKHGNLCVVGDEDQAIYSWRGAERPTFSTLNRYTLMLQPCLWSRIIGHPKILSMSPINSSSGIKAGTTKTCLQRIRQTNRLRSKALLIISTRRNTWCRKFRRLRIYQKWQFCIVTIPLRSH